MKNAIYSNENGSGNYHTTWNKSERESQLPYDIIYMWNLKCNTNDFIYKTEPDSDT